METDIKKRDKEYKKKWNKHHRHPLCKEHKFKIGNKLLLKRRKLNKWSPTHEKEYFRIIGIQDSSIRARRNSDWHTVRIKV